MPDNPQCVIFLKRAQPFLRLAPLHNPGFLRTSGTDATSCADCHNQPTIGGAGGFVANVFLLAQNLDPIADSVSSEFSNERNTLAMNVRVKFVDLLRTCRIET